VNIDIPGIDATEGVARYAHDVDIYLSILRSYAANTPALAARLRGATAETVQDYVIDAHGLKGSSGNVCAKQISAGAARLEAAARNGDSAVFLPLLETVLNDVDTLVADIRAWFEKYDENKPRQDAPDREILAKLKKSCEAYDISGIDEAMDELESATYDTGADLVAWLRERVDIMELDEVIERLENIASEI
jgi:HPt (histidine-containing phosphotransfer) domain-containing protein